MPDSFLIKEFLIENRSEVEMICLTEYNEAETMNMFKEEGREEGRREAAQNLAVYLMSEDASLSEEEELEKAIEIATMKKIN